MSEIVESAAFTRLYQLAKAAGVEGYVAIAAIDSPTSLTKGKEYRILLDRRDDTLYYEDDAEIPVYLVYPEDLKRFEPMVDMSDIIEKITDASGRIECRTQELVAELLKIPTAPTDLKPGDVVVFEEAEEDKPYVVAKILNREERLIVAKVLETLVIHDVLVYHLNGGIAVSILPSHKTRKVSSLQELGLEPLAPEIIEKLTVFDAVQLTA